MKIETFEFVGKSEKRARLFFKKACTSRCGTIVYADLWVDHGKRFAYNNRDKNIDFQKRPTTFTGEYRFPKLPSPTWPKELSPQH
jgi:hypothetical protein